MLKIAATNTSVALRWTLPRSLVDECPSKQGLSFALNLAPATHSYNQLRDAEAKYKWVHKKALGADQWNRGLETSGLLIGVLSAFHGLDKVCYGDDPEAAGKAYPSSTKSGRTSMRMLGDPGAPAYNVMTMDAYASQFTGDGTASLNMEKPPLRKLMAKIDENEGALFLMGTCWKIEFYDERTKPAPELPLAKRARCE